ncbi:MAG: prepilin-type N-terminal cleavage/methylation domain-containing protein [Candidatus Eisenbacteria bacterium]
MTTAPRFDSSCHQTGAFAVPSRNDSLRRAVSPRRHSKGFTLVEMAVVIVIIGILATLGTNAYTSMIERARVVQAIGDIRAISYAVDDYYIGHGEYPPNLAAVGQDDRIDPWGNAYAYQRVTGNGGGTRKDKNLVPINTDYDLYSKGADGKSAPPLTANSSKDDVVRAANGGFIGLAVNY